MPASRPSPGADLNEASRGTASRPTLGLICYTSGTTHPKGAMPSNRSVVASAVGTVLMAAAVPTTA